METPRLPAGSAGGVAGLGDPVYDAAFWDLARVLVGAVGAGGRGGTTLRRAGGVIAGTRDGSLSDAALGRAGGSGGAGGAEGLGEALSPPCILREGSAGTMREGADETGRAGGGGGGALPGTIGGPAVFRAGTAGATATPRGGAGGTAVDGADISDGCDGGDCFRGGIAGTGRD